MRLPFWRRLFSGLASAGLLSILALACGDGGEDEAGAPSPSATETAPATGTPASTGAATATASPTPPASPMATPTPVLGPPLTVGPLTIHVGTDKEAYQSGESVAMTLIVAASEPSTLYFRTSQRFDFAVADADGQVLWHWAADRTFLQVLGQETVEPPGELVYRAVWRQTGAGGLRVPPGVYTVTGQSAHCDEDYDDCGAAAASTTIEILGQ